MVVSDARQSAMVIFSDRIFYSFLLGPLPITACDYVAPRHQGDDEVQHIRMLSPALSMLYIVSPPGGRFPLGHPDFKSVSILDICLGQQI